MFVVPVDETLSKLKCLNYNNSRDWYVRIHKKQDLPRRYHYINNRCIDEIVMDLEEDYYLGEYDGPNFDNNSLNCSTKQ